MCGQPGSCRNPADTDLEDALAGLPLVVVADQLSDGLVREPLADFREFGIVLGGPVVGGSDEMQELGMELLGDLCRLRSRFASGERSGAEDVLQLDFQGGFARRRVEVELANPFGAGRVIPDASPGEAQFAAFDLEDRCAITGFVFGPVDPDRQREQEVFGVVVGGLFSDGGPDFSDLARVAGPPRQLAPCVVQQLRRLGVGQVKAVECGEAGC
jgi:hypothetical protein